MKIEIEDRLKNLLGLPLENAGRTGNLVWFSFGKTVTMKNRNGTEKKVAEYALNVQCSWRITQEYEILVASGDIYLPSKRFNGAEEEFKWDIQGMNRCDERLKEFFKTLKSDIFVESIQADKIGGVKIFFTKHYLLELFPDESTKDEFWRIFVPGNASSHFVVTGNGIED